MKLSELQTNQTGIVLKIHGHGAFRKRVIEMGFVKGHAVKVLLHAPLKDPINYSILGYEISLRRAEADLIEVVAVDDAVADEAVADTPAPRSRRKAVVRIDETSGKEEQVPKTSTARTSAPRRPRRKKEDGETKELFAFYEQSLF